MALPLQKIVYIPEPAFENINFQPVKKRHLVRHTYEHLSKKGRGLFRVDILAHLAAEDSTADGFAPAAVLLFHQLMQSLLAAGIIEQHLLE